MMESNPTTPIQAMNSNSKNGERQYNAYHQQQNVMHDLFQSIYTKENDANIDMNDNPYTHGNVR